ncbi:MAG: SDR family oxidoreductase [Gemmatimonadetes bacterium]|nr:SDR family oxidoreductase [Gemmatimonadota bacterium]
MHILLTGTEGYLGSRMAPYLAERGIHVTGLDTGFYREAELYPNGTHRIVCIRKDVRDVVAEELEGFDAVVHLAELSNDPLGQLDPELTERINHRGSVRLAREAKRAGVPRFVYMSSCSVYGVGTGDEVKTEASAPNPQTAYARCKLLVERDVSAMADDDFSPTFLRNATAYGPSPRMRFDLVLNNLAGYAWTTRQIRMTSDGTPWRPLVHALDIAEAVRCVLEAPRDVVHGQIFNVGASTENYQVRDIAAAVAEAFPGCEVTFGNSDGDNRSYRVSFDKIARALPAFRCRHDLRSGAHELYELFSRIGLTPEAFESRNFTRIKQLKHLLATGRLTPELRWAEAVARS